MIHLTAGCKVNLGLHVLGVRADGYHELDSLFYPLSTAWRFGKTARRASWSVAMSRAWTHSAIR